MPRIILSLALIVLVGGALAFGATGAFFSDTETSTANAFTAGAVDLKIDNESYYNGVANEGTSWDATDLTDEKFFDFDDLKPSDYGEDTISLHVDTNDSYLCADVTLTSDNDNGLTEPEGEVDTTPGPVGEGELADSVNFVWWADDGDNVLETGENVISEGPIGALELNTPFPVTLADSGENIWNDGSEGGPVAGEETVYIGKAWCFGALGTAPVTQDGLGNAISPNDDNNDNQTAGEPEDGGITCDGAEFGNETQTDSLTADISFEAVQARHNDTFQCAEPEEPPVACVPSESNIFVNGGFETPVVAHPDKWDVFAAAITGWTIAWRSDVPTIFNSVIRPEPGNLELHSGVLGAAHSGVQYAELDSDWDGHANTVSGEPASTVISQTIPTIVGAKYKVDYWFAPRPGTTAANNKVIARVNGAAIDTVGPTAGGGGNLVVGDWQHREPAEFIATTTSAVISFTDEGTADSLGSFIDDVSVLQTVCPL